MNKSNLKSYAPQARKDFIAAITARAALLGITADRVVPATVSGGVGQTFAALLEEKGGNARFFHEAVPDTFVKQASVDSQLRKFGLDKASIVSEVNHAEENPA